MDQLIRVVFGFADQRLYPAANPSLAERLSVVATGGYAQLIASKMPEIKAVDPLLTLEGLRLVAQASCIQVPRRPRRA